MEEVALTDFSSWKREISAALATTIYLMFTIFLHVYEHVSGIIYYYYELCFGRAFTDNDDMLLSAR